MVASHAQSYGSGSGPSLRFSYSFRKDGTMVFQMQVLPGYRNRLVWNFSEAGYYDVRSTEYSGSRHPDMFAPDAILVEDRVL